MFNKIYENIKNYIKENFKFLLTLLLIVAVFWIRLPFLIYTPGGTVDLDKRITVEKEIEKDGKLQMTYVSMVRGSIPFILASYVLPDWDLVKSSEITLEDESVEDMIKRDQIFLQQSVDNATLNAYRFANKDIEITKINNHVIFIHEEAKTTLKLYDQIIKANEIKINSLDDYLDIVTSSKLGDIIEIEVLRNDKIKTAQAEVILLNGELKTGISVINTYEYKTDPKLEISNKQSESGSSGGLMMALSIYNKLNSKDITKGLNIVGTGAIDEKGNVEEIGGVKYKLIGAVKNKADIFICPQENLEEALKVVKKNKYDIKVIGVSTFTEAIEKLEEI